MYHIGDRVVYPMHGAGIIESIEERRILQQRCQYYVMKMPVGDMTVMIPVANSEEIGIRDVITEDEARLVLDEFEKLDIDTNDNWNKRYRENMEKIKDGRILDVACVVKSLMVRDKLKGLSTGERKMLTTAKRIFISELVLSELGDSVRIEERINSIVDQVAEKILA